MHPLVFSYGALLIAIVSEVIGTTYLQRSQQFTLIGPTVLMGLFYLSAFFFLSQALRHMPVGIAYAIWSGLGIVLISAVGYFRFGQKLDLAALSGIGLILIGVMVINLFSRSVGH
ncbi:DMT family transporter [Paracoccus aminophilus]|uniref:Quaternary ammonium compound-resistance protein n=1 Tax=Paracoccus aminophilus JCM 7686 TaxID=1367847 RepID=S5YYQ8_PARAH|nr:multidrug efflux SMR transporter [Paracoccus aminophilus]AGT10356.1 quaternary ammonium compound-resistance protein [Paracoccus aminophilus JCM 7686]